MATVNSFKTRTNLLTVASPAPPTIVRWPFYSLRALEAAGFPSVARLPFSLKILLENLLRHEDGRFVKKADIEALARWDVKSTAQREMSFAPARVLLQDFTGVPCVVDLAAMRDGIARLGGDPNRVNPLQPVELVRTTVRAGRGAGIREVGEHLLGHRHVRRVRDDEQLRHPLDGRHDPHGPRRPEPRCGPPGPARPAARDPATARPRRPRAAGPGPPERAHPVTPRWPPRAPWPGPGPPGPPPTRPTSPATPSSAAAPDPPTAPPGPARSPAPPGPPCPPRSR